MSDGARVEGLVLAAGASRRSGGCKALAPIDAEPLLERTVRVLEAGGCARIRVVIAAPHGDAIARALPDLDFVWNARPELGMLVSLQTGLAAVDADAVVVALVDHPRVRPATVVALIEAWRRHGAPLVRPVYDGRRGHPYLVARPTARSLCAAPPETNARQVLRSIASLDIDVDDPGVLEDLDTRAALLGARTSTYATAVSGAHRGSGSR